jgi:hypothetical protein
MRASPQFFLGASKKLVTGPNDIMVAQKFGDIVVWSLICFTIYDLAFHYFSCLSLNQNASNWKSTNYKSQCRWKAE